MQILAAAAGLALIVVTLTDGFAVMVLPRRLTWPYQPARLFYRAAWGVATAARFLSHPKRRQHLLSVFGPLSLLALFTAWVSALIAGFALLHGRLGTPVNGPPGERADWPLTCISAASPSSRSATAT